MKPAPLVHLRPGSLQGALAALAEAAGEGKVLAGGQSLVPLLNLRLATPQVLVDVQDVPGLRQLRADGDELLIGALVTHDRVVRYPAPLPGFEHLRAAGELIGHLPVRTRGTFGGSVAHADPLGEWVLLCLLHDAVLDCVSAEGARQVGIADFLHGPFLTDLGDAELLVQVRLRRPFGHAALREFARRPGDFAVVAVAVGFDVVDGAIDGSRVAVAGAGAVPARVPRAEAVLDGGTPSASLFAQAGQVAAASAAPTSDGAGSAGYRRALVAGLLEEACAAALGTAP